MRPTAACDNLVEDGSLESWPGFWMRLYLQVDGGTLPWMVETNTAQSTSQPTIRMEIHIRSTSCFPRGANKGS